MSKYIIYRVDHHDPAWIGKRRRRLGVFFGIALSVTALAVILIPQIFHIGIVVTYLGLIALVAGVTWAYYLRIRWENNKIKAIGEIEFTRESVIKQIGDSGTVISYESISSVDLMRHIPALNASDSKSGYYTYTLTLNFKDLHIENLIVSDRPSGKWEYISIVETLKTLQKLNCVRINNVK
jgi:hypothetical protein